MISLARHIELLLLEHDCVIVPGLGGFITNHCEAKYNEGGDNLFIPPYRTVGFNKKLQVNDGLLVQSYMSAYDASYPAAFLQMQKDVEEMIRTLETTGEVVLEGVGTLQKALNENITFTSAESGILSPSLFGLYSLEMHSLADALKMRQSELALQAAANTQVANIKQVQEEKKEGKDYVIRLRRKWIDFAISAAAALILFFGISYPSIYNNQYDGDTCVATTCNIIDKPNVVTSKKVTKVSKQKQPSKAATEAEATQAVKVKQTEEILPKETINESQTSNFTIVLASYVSKNNSEEYIAKLTKEGFSEGRYVKTGKVSRVIYSGFKTEEAAYAKLRELRSTSKEFSEAWIMALE